MKQELEINGKVYTLIANRAVSTLMEKCIKVDGMEKQVLKCHQNPNYFMDY